MYVCMLRGVNVAGHNKVAMADLRRVFDDLGHTDVTTYVQSGNVIFGSGAEPSAPAIEQRIARDLGVDAAAIIRTHEELARVVAGNPFRGNDVSRLHVTFMGNMPDASLTAGIPATAAAPDEFDVVGKEVYLYCPNGYGRTKLNNTFWERRLRVPATTRNWTSVTKLTDVSGG